MSLNRYFRVLMLAVAVLMTACVSLLAPTVTNEVAKLRSGEYSLDRAHATLLFKVQHLGLSTYVGRFNEFSASLDFDPANIGVSKLDGIIDIDSLDINNTALAEDLLSSAWFDAKRYPQATFSTKTVKLISGNDYEYIGELNWRGVTKEIPVLVTFHGGASNILTGKYTLGFSAKASLLRSEFGMDAYIPIVGDQIEIEIFAEFQKN